MEGKAKNDEAIQVVVRCRPMNSKEKNENRRHIIDIDSEAHTVSIRNPDNQNENPKLFTYDATYDENTKQKFFYEESCFSVIEGTLEGFNSTIFAYGQTGCGKSFTMQGPSTTDEEMRGVIPNSFYHIFQFVKSSKGIEFLIRCSYLELYNEEIRDLLTNAKNPVKCEVHEDPQKGVYVKNLTDVVVESPEDLLKIFDKGVENRTTAATNMNAESSRSHSIFTIVVEMSTKDPGSGKEMLRVGKLNLVDLAGSERQKKTGAKDATLKEGIKINLSLSALGNVISALSEGSKHIPYRDSKLTRLLQDSLGGNTKTMMVAAISPADYNHEETTSTLRYANRAKNIKNKPKINEDPKDTMIREFKAEILRLRALLEEQSRTGHMPQLMQLIPAAQQQQQQLESQQQHAAAVAAASSPQQPQQQQQQPKKSPKRAAAAAESPKSHDALEHEMNILGEAGEALAVPVEKSSLASSNTQTTAADDEDEYGDENWATESGDLVDRGMRQQEQGYYSPDKDHMTTKEMEAHQKLVDAAQHGDQDAQDKLLREGVEHRLHQLEGMLMASETDSNARIVKQPSGAAAVPALTLEQIKAEERDLEAYRQRRQAAKKKREAQKQKEMQRIVDEKQSMEEELEELRLMVAQGQNSNASAAAAASAESEALLTKKITKIRKKYEKKLNAAKEELEDLREDFDYQRKQLMDAITEQEKDSKLYEIICRSLLSDKDLRKLISRCKYDEDSDEWIVPFTKKKSLQELQMNNNDANNSYFPDINQPKAGNGSDGGSSEQERVGTRGGNRKNKNGGEKANAEAAAQHRTPSIVPLLTLPGHVVTSAALISPVGTRSSLPTRMPALSDLKSQVSPRAGHSSAREGGDTEGLPALEKKKGKGSKNKIPKIPNRNGSGGDFGTPPTIGSDHAMSSARSATNKDGSEGAMLAAALATEEGAGVSAGPIEDWGFQEPKAGSSHNPELEYSDDEDFESAGDGKANGGQRKKKKKKSKNRSSDFEHAPPPEKERVALPPI